MKVTVLGSHLCEDTRNALKVLEEKNFEVKFKNFSEDLAFLKEFLEIRETNQLYEAVRANKGLGIPCFCLEDGSMTLDLENVLAMK